MSSPFYIERLILKNIRCFKHLDIRFKKRGESIVVVGDNGDGKSTILRSLAIGICDQSSASALFRELHGEFVRAGSPKGRGTIDVQLKGRGREHFRIVTTINTLKAFEQVDQKLYRITGNRRKLLNQDKFPPVGVKLGGKSSNLGEVVRLISGNGYLKAHEFSILH